MQAEKEANLSPGEEDELALLDFAASYAQLCDDERTIPLESLELEMVVRQDTRLGQGGAVWDSALALVAFCEHERAQSSMWWQALCEGHKREGEQVMVVELGAGTGLAGLAVGILLGRARVVLTDLEAYLPLLHHNAALDLPLLHARGSSAHVTSYQWGEAPPALPEGEGLRYDVVVGSDLVYDAAKPGFDWRRNHQDLVASFDLLAHPEDSAKTTTVVLAVERRRESAHYYEAFFATVRGQGWSCHAQPFSVHGGADTLILTIRRAAGSPRELV